MTTPTDHERPIRPPNRPCDHEVPVRPPDRLCDHERLIRPTDRLCDHEVPVRPPDRQCDHGQPIQPVTISQRKNWDPGSETSPLLEENTSLSGLAGKSGRGAQPGLRGRNQQTFPGGLVVRIRRSHRRGPGSIPGQGMSFCPPAAVVIACRTPADGLVEKHGQGKKTSFEPESNQRPKDC
ncbi:hypothetical protein PO909_025039 [Leuciscus waleckii]